MIKFEIPLDKYVHDYSWGTAVSPALSKFKSHPNGTRYLARIYNLLGTEAEKEENVAAIGFSSDDWYLLRG